MSVKDHNRKSHMLEVKYFNIASLTETSLFLKGIGFICL